MNKQTTLMGFMYVSADNHSGETYDVFDDTAPKKSKTANWSCSCGAEGYPPKEVKYKSTLGDRIRAHLLCRCPIWNLKTARKKQIYLLEQNTGTVRQKLEIRSTKHEGEEIGR